jgi:DNA-binding beta-propeller fold protein YncE
MRCRSTWTVLACALAAAAAAQASDTVVWSGVTLNGVGGVAGLARPSDVAISPDGLFAYATGNNEDSILRFTRDPATGALVYVDRVIGDTATPPGPVPHLHLPKALALSPDGAHLYVAGGTAGAGTSSVTWFERDALTGALAYRDSALDDGGAGLYSLDTPLDVLVSADGENVYVTAFEARAVTVFARDAGSGDLAPLQVVADDEAGVDGLEGIQRLAESPDGASLYVASQSRPVTVAGVGGVAAFARAGDGTLTFLEVEQQGAGGVDGLGAPRDVAVSPDGADVYVAAGGRTGTAPPFAAAIAHFERAPDGTLSFVASIPESALGGGEPRGIAVAPDGARVYATAYGVHSGTGGLTPGKLAVFARDAGTGALTLVDRFDDGQDGVEGLAGALRVVASGDGAHLYVVGELDPAAPPPGFSTGAVARFGAAPPGPACANGIDDDADGALDFPADPQCASAGDLSEKPDCRNGRDDDADTAVDHPDDAQCTSAQDVSERVDCTNGQDDDADGLVDAADPGCSNPAAPDRESPQCDDGKDNDGDGRIDWDGGPASAPIDPECSGKPARNKEAACGLGAELALLLLAARRRRGPGDAPRPARLGRRVR